MYLKRKILVIDDDQSACDMIARTLKKQGYEVFTDTHHQEGVEKAGEVLPDLVFISLLLNTTNGLKVSKEIHAIEKLRKVPVIMLISYKGELDPKYTLTIGIVDVLVKPLSERDIISKTVAILGPDASQNADAEEGSSEATDIEKIRRAFGETEEHVLDSEEATEEKLFSPVDEYRDLDEMTGEEMQHTEEPVLVSVNPLGGSGETGKEPLFDRSFGLLDDSIDEETESPEYGSEAISEEEEQRDEESERQRDVTAYLIDEAKQKESRKKILMIAVTLILIAVIGMGTYMGLQFFFAGKDGTAVPSSVHEPRVKENAEPQQNKTEPLPLTVLPETEAKEPLVTAPEQHMEKEKAEKPAAAAKQGSAEPALKNNRTVKESSGSETQKNGTYSTQVGFFRSMKNAESLVEKMKKKGYEAFIKQEERAAGEMSYRVLVGKFKSSKEALEQAEVIFRKEGIKSVLYKD